MRRALSVTAVLASCSLLACSSTDSDPEAARSAAVGDDSVQVTPDGVVTREAALVAFARVFGPLEGAPGAGPDRAPRRSGSGALRWVLAHHHELTDAQRAGVRALVEGPNVGLAPASLTASASQRAEIRPQGIAEAKSLLDAVVTDVGTRLGRPLKAKIALATTSVDYSGTAYTFPFNAAGENPFAKPLPPKSTRPTYGEMAECRITLTPDGLALAGGHPKLRASLQHEVFHCFMIDLVGIDTFLDLPPWLVEGSAAWVGESAVGGTDLSQKWWAGYLTAPGQTLFARAYDAIGFYSLLDARGTSPWPLADAMFKAGATNSTAPYLIATDAAGESFIRAWPAGYARNPAFGPDWEAFGPGITGDRASIAHTSIGTGANLAVDAPPHTNAIVSADLEAEVITVDVTTAGTGVYGLVHAADDATTPLRAGAFCTKGDECKCPDGTEAARKLERIARGRSLYAVAGHTGSARLDLRGTTLAEFCSRPIAQSNVTFSGAFTDTMTVLGSCAQGALFSASFSWTSKTPGPLANDGNVIVFTITINDYTGPGTYDAYSSSSISGGYAIVSGGLGKSFSVEERQPGAITVGAGGLSGTINVLMKDKPTEPSSSVTASGSWRCERVD